MPEGDTVWRQARSLHKALAGRIAHSTSFRYPNVAEYDFSGQRIHGALAVGKHLLLRIGEHSVHSHLKMDGIWHVYGVDDNGNPARWKRPAHLARAVVNANARQDASGQLVQGSTPVSAVGFTLGLLEIFPTTEENDRLGYLGPDLLGADWNPALALENLLAQPERPIGPALLDQKNLQGIGTIFRAETLFLAGLHPMSPVGSVPDLPRVIEIAHLLLVANRMRPKRVTRTDREPLWCYGRGGRACYRCGRPIISEEISNLGTGAERFGVDRYVQTEDTTSRISYRCPQCQVMYGEQV
ncbi:DNA-formamidopyrimidine glycosylase family protein [Rothia sp. ZJ932]|uniref:DNA-formamidopyrimidine glycosylase family protein n=1 Tax=Rothia sp. ZJ932 TaxID=2810516 RepID=UPI0019688797|nr:DNA-formamidopyrimidine glycosylase family protein [Rothia sp. ZJ932]QRZ61356.1 Fpg/Nei family DNA glycosylase [Rothia sp. ZJ932]